MVEGSCGSAGEVLEFRVSEALSEVLEFRVSELLGPETFSFSFS